MTMTRGRRYSIGSRVGLILLAGLLLFAVGQGASADRAGTLDDGAELLPKAGITLDEAVSSAKLAATGAVGEVDLEYWQGRLVFNVDIGDGDVKVDASSGDVIAVVRDD